MFVARSRQIMGCSRLESSSAACRFASSAPADSRPFRPRWAGGQSRSFNRSTCTVIFESAVPSTALHIDHVDPVVALERLRRDVLPEAVRRTALPAGCSGTATGPACDLRRRSRDDGPEMRRATRPSRRPATTTVASMTSSRDMPRRHIRMRRHLAVGAKDCALAIDVVAGDVRFIPHRFVYNYLSETSGSMNSSDGAGRSGPCQTRQSPRPSGADAPVGRSTLHRSSPAV